jgi:hypothetical protein
VTERVGLRTEREFPLVRELRHFADVALEALTVAFAELLRAQRTRKLP